MQETKYGVLKLIEISVPSMENWPWGGEPVLKEEEFIGNLTSVGYTQDNSKLLGLIMTNISNVNSGMKMQVQCGTDLYDAIVL